MCYRQCVCKIPHIKITVINYDSLPRHTRTYVCMCLRTYTYMHILHTYVVHRRNSQPLTINRHGWSVRLNKENILLEFLILSDCNQRILQMTNASEPICICMAGACYVGKAARRPAGQCDCDCEWDCIKCFNHISCLLSPRLAYASASCRPQQTKLSYFRDITSITTKRRAC